MKEIKMKSILISITLILCSVLSTMAALEAPQNLRIGTGGTGELHDFTGLPITAEGWTDFDTLTDSGYSSARVLFVSSLSGNDTSAANNITSNGHYGISDVTFDSNGIFQAPIGVIPFATIATAYDYCRNGYPDILLLERGGSWTAGLGVDSPVAGSSQTTPHIIASYGSSGDRPKLSEVPLSVDTDDSDYLVVSGIEFYAADWEDAFRAIDVGGTATYQTFEDCYFDGTEAVNIIGTSVDHIVFRRCIWLHGDNRDGQMYEQFTSNFLLEDCIFYEPYSDSYPSLTQFGRHLYMANPDTGNGKSSDITIRGCIFFGGDREGVDLRGGGNFYHNLVVQGAVYVGDRGSETRYQTAADVYQNVLLEGSPRDGDPTTIVLSGNDGSKVYDNIISDNRNVTRSTTGIVIIGESGSTPPLLSAKNIEIYDNIIYDLVSSDGKGYGIRILEDLTSIENIYIHDNDVQMPNGHGGGALMMYSDTMLAYNAHRFENNKYYSTGAESSWFKQGNLSAWVSNSGETGASSTQISYTAPTRTVGSYNGTIGGLSTSKAFMAAALKQSRSNWTQILTAYAAINYIRAGFDKAPIHAKW